MELVCIFSRRSNIETKSNVPVVSVNEIESWKDKLAAMEDAYFAKFTRMEAAMAKMNASTSSITSLLGSL